MSNNTGGPAFPTSNGGSPDDGMTLRDYFAAKAMQALIGTVFTDQGLIPTVHADVDDDEHLSLRAYDVADAMLKARQA
jgi:hypothetical protein